MLFNRDCGRENTYMPVVMHCMVISLVQQYIYIDNTRLIPTQ